MTTNSELNDEERWEQFYRRMLNLANEGWELFQTMDPVAWERLRTSIISMTMGEYYDILAMRDAVFQRCMEIWYWAFQNGQYLCAGGAGFMFGGAIAKGVCGSATAAQSVLKLAATVGVTAVVGTVAVAGAYHAGKKWEDQGIAGKCGIAATTTGVGAAVGGIAAAKSAVYLGCAATNTVIVVGAVVGAVAMGGAAVYGHIVEKDRRNAELERENAALRQEIDELRRINANMQQPTHPRGTMRRRDQ